MPRSIRQLLAREDALVTKAMAIAAKPTRLSARERNQLQRLKDNICLVNKRIASSPFFHGEEESRYTH